MAILQKLKSGATVECDYKISDLCYGIYNVGQRYYYHLIKPGVKVKCSACASKRYTTNWQYDLDNDEFSAWLYGLWASDGSILDNRGIGIILHEQDKDVVETVAFNVGRDIKKLNDRPMWGVYYYSNELLDEFRTRLNLQSNLCKTEGLKQLPNISFNMMRHYIRGFFEGDGTLTNSSRRIQSPVAEITCYSKSTLEQIGEFVGVPYSIFLKHNITDHNFVIKWYGEDAIKFLDYIYKDCNYKCARKYRMFLKWSNITINNSKFIKEEMFKYKRIKTNAVELQKANETDSGYDITVIELIKQENNIYYYSTGIQLIADKDVYFQLHNRSSLHKRGYMLANNVGIIDNGYRGEIILALYKFNEYMPDLELPAKVAQLIPCTNISNVTAEEVDDFYLFVETARQNKGFGSSGN